MELRRLRVDQLLREGAVDDARALVRQVLPEAGITGADHVLIGRDAGLTRDFAALDADLRKALAKCSGAK